MRTVYVDNEYKCHLIDDGTMTAIETDFFDGSCDELVEGYCIKTTSDGCRKIYPWKPTHELDVAQRDYERQLLAEYEAVIDELYSEVTN